MPRCRNGRRADGRHSAEREVSLKSGAAVTAALRSAGISAEAIDWNGTLDGQLRDSDYARYFIALHGRGGEDGQVQAVLELLGKPYTGTRVLGCALSMDKYRTKLAWLGAGLPTPPFVKLERGWRPGQRRYPRPAADDQAGARGPVSASARSARRTNCRQPSPRPNVTTRSSSPNAASSAANIRCRSSPGKHFR